MRVARLFHIKHIGILGRLNMTNGIAIPEWKKKAEEFLIPYVGDLSDFYNLEALIYFLSRGHECGEAVDKVVGYWKEMTEKIKNSYGLDVTNTPMSTVTKLRFVQWGNVQSYKNYWATIPPFNMYDGNNIVNVCINCQTKSLQKGIIFCQ